MLKKVLVVACFTAIALQALWASDRELRAELVLNAPLEEVWRAWASPEGLESFFAPACRIEPQVGGDFEILFFPDAPRGRKGAEGLTILQFEPQKRLAFTWSAPPSLPEVRHQRTVVLLDFQRLDGERTQLTFRHLGFGVGEPWDRCFDYFDQAWNEAVLPRLRHALEQGPIDFANPPKLQPAAATLKTGGD